MPSSIHILKLEQQVTIAYRLRSRYGLSEIDRHIVFLAVESQSPIGSGPDMDITSEGAVINSVIGHNRLSAPVPIWTQEGLDVY